MNALQRQKCKGLGPVVAVVASTIGLLCLPLGLALVERRTSYLEGYVPQPYWLATLIVAAAAFAIAPQDRRPDRRALRWLLPLGALVPAADLEMRVVLSLAFLAGLSSCVRSGGALATRLFSTVIVFVAAIAGWEAYCLLDSQFDAASVLAPAFAAVTLGNGRLLEGGDVALTVDGAVRIIHVSADKLGGPFLASLVCAAVTWSLLVGLGWKDALGRAAVCLAYGLGWAVFLMCRTAGATEFSWWDEPTLAVGFLPLCIGLGLWSRNAALPRPARRLQARTWATAVCCFGVILAVAGWCFVDPGTQKRGAVLIDESHGEWEDSRSPIDGNWYGARTVYNYYNFYREIERHFPVRRSIRPITPEDLNGVSVVILKTPTRPYDPAFIRLLERFVSTGGGLWLVGDHTDAFGMSTYLNQVARRFGLEFRKDAYVEPPVKRNLWLPGPMSDPVVSGLGTFLFYTGCSLKIGALDVPLMMGNRQILEPADYSAGSFFGPLRSSPNNKQGTVAMAALAHRGAGRVAMWSDSTLFSNFSIYIPGKLELGLNTIEWLNRRNAYSGLRPAALLLGLASVAFALALSDMTVVAVCLVLAAGVAPLAKAACVRLAPLVEAERDRRRDVVFLERQPSPHLPVLLTIDEKGPAFYLSSFLAVQRSGLRPGISADPSDMRGARTAVYIPYLKGLNPSDEKRLVAWVRDGGHLMVLDAGGFATQAVRSLAAEFGLELKSGVPPKDGKPYSVRDLVYRPYGKDYSRLRITGGEPVLTCSEDNGTVAATKASGKGRVFFSVTGSLFSDQSLGDVFHVPNDEELRVHRLLHGLYKEGCSPARG